MAKAREIVIVMEDDTIFHYTDCDDVSVRNTSDEQTVVLTQRDKLQFTKMNTAGIGFTYKEFKLICPRGRQKPSMTWQTTYEPVRSAIIE